MIVQVESLICEVIATQEDYLSGADIEWSIITSVPKYHNQA